LGGEFKKVEVTVPVTGAFNRANAVMALAVTHLITGAVCSEPLTRWRGIRRRQDILFERQEFIGAWLTMLIIQRKLRRC
jgi:UDP-N-acetylmuramate-alanine ligase